MDKDQKKELTTPHESSIILSDSEERIILNLRKITEAHGYGTLTAEITYHDGTLSSGLVVDNKIKL